jgi:hypothetical protein
MFEMFKVGLVVTCLAYPLVTQKAVAAEKSTVTAIDVALEPDATMIKHAQAANDRLLKVFPKGYSLDATHKPHITMIQRFVRTEELHKVYEAVGKVLEHEKGAGKWELKATKYYYLSDGDMGLAGIVVEPSPDMLKLQQEIIEAVAPYTVETGTAAAFVTTAKEPDISKALIDYVTTFVPKASGEHFNPHVSVGVGTTEYLKKMVEEPFSAFTSSPAGVGIYQLGPFGTAAKKLKTYEFKH